MKTFSLKVSDDDPVAVYLASQSNISATLRAIVADYLARGGAGRLPPRREPEAPSPSQGFDYDRMEKGMLRAMRQALKEAQIAVPTTAALNRVEVDEPDGMDGAELTDNPEATRRAMAMCVEQFG